MKVAIDVSQMNRLSKKRGIGTYGQNLFESIKKYTALDIEIVNKKSSLKKFDLVHFPFFDIYKHTLPLHSGKPAVVTIHDLIPIQFADHYPSGIKGKINWQLQKLALKNVESIIAVSNTVKQDIIKLLKVPQEKISVVYSASSEKFHKISDQKLLKKITEKYYLPEEFVLYVGNINWNKNILNMTEAVLKSGKELVIVGNAFEDKSNLEHPEKKSFKIWLEKYSTEKKIKILGFLETEDLVCVMSLAKCLVFVSYYEGFGLPILEAQSAGCPVITSKISATAEIAGKGAILVDPESITEIAQSIENLFTNIEIKKKLISEGYLNAQKFTSKNTATQTVKIYEKTLNRQS